jgi:plasmid maintenance system killer protein
MIRSFADPRVERFFRDGICPARWQAFENAAKRKLDIREFLADMLRHVVWVAMRRLGIAASIFVLTRT